ncbi:ASCL4 protein, partial [Amia calva]|nr:ASCL4 protein [Amia calva]
MDLLPNPRSVSISFPLDHPGVALREPFRWSFPVDPSCLHQAYPHRYTGRFSYVPFPEHLGVYDYSFEPTFIRKRNERERQRVRCVNEGYARLRQHLPQEFEDKRLSKVETLRAAISYIRHLQDLLDVHVSDASSKERPLSCKNPTGPSGSLQRTTDCSSDAESKISFSDSGDMSS